MIKKLYTLLGLLSLLVLLAGCASGGAHVTVHRNGSIDLAVNLQLDSRAESLISGTLEDKLTSSLSDAGIELKKTKDGNSAQYQFMKSYASFEEIRATSGNWDVVDTTVETADRWLFTRYDVQAQPKLKTYADNLMDTIGTPGLSKPLVRLLMANLTFDFKLTLPLDLIGDNNAAVDEGRTVAWNISLADTDPVQLVVYVPNIKNIVITLSILAVGMVAIILWIIRVKRRNKPTERKE
ncbi:hypothetical protein [Paenibacillus donghaensis]|uniref:DUF3153 domain-containing protein n=1 Tax=Paenibacillus donghaensis TaxID=414771 RepID=A0A2Z2KE93_9BACL|nr:hypothetical protein [Paenibacillus donghaensis]ASA24027.1 hypothetical protein B9T62_26535 [Paenibacillus donghaensis]